MNELTKNWRIVLACFFGISLSTSSIPFYTLGVFTVPLQAEFGWSRAQVQGAMAFLTLGSLITVPFVGMAIDRYGTRAVGLVSIIILSLTLMNIGWTTSSLPIFYLNWILMSGFAAGTTPITWTRALNGWFDKQRGIALGFALAGTGVAGFTTPQLATFLVEQYGWRLAYVGLGCLPLLISLPMVFFLLRDPPVLSDKSTDAEKSLAISNQQGMTLSQAIRGWKFWVIAIAFFGISIGIGGTISNLVPLLNDNGFDLATAASVAGTIGLSVIVGRIIAGFLIDRFWAPAVAFFVFSLPAISCWMLSGEVQSVSLAVVAAALIGLAAGAEFDMISYLTSRYFGLKHYGKIYAWQFAAFSIGAGFSPPVFGRVFDLYGSYGPILMVSGLLYLGGAVMLLTLGRYPSFAPGSDTRE